jgi:hypothetical protein
LSVVVAHVAQPCRDASERVGRSTLQALTGTGAFPNAKAIPGG